MTVLLNSLTHQGRCPWGSEVQLKAIIWNKLAKLKGHTMVTGFLLQKGLLESLESRTNNIKGSSRTGKNSTLMSHAELHGVTSTHLTRFHKTNVSSRWCLSVLQPLRRRADSSGLAQRLWQDRAWWKGTISKNGGRRRGGTVSLSFSTPCFCVTVKALTAMPTKSLLSLACCHHDTTLHWSVPSSVIKDYHSFLSPQLIFSSSCRLCHCLF